MKKLWFKKKTYGWGRTPATQEGWLVVLLYIVIMVALGLSVDYDSPSETMFIFVIPFVLLTIALIRISYKMGEKPEWSWGDKKKKEQ